MTPNEILTLPWIFRDPEGWVLLLVIVLCAIAIFILGIVMPVQAWCLRRSGTYRRLTEPPAVDREYRVRELLPEYSRDPAPFAAPAVKGLSRTTLDKVVVAFPLRRVQ